MVTAEQCKDVAGSPTLLRDLVGLRAEIVTEGTRLLEAWRPALHRRAFLPSAVNLAHYIALRRRDVRMLQEALMPLGLSSLGRCEGRVLPNLDAVIASLAWILDEDCGPIRHPRAAAFYRGNRLLRRHTEAVFGPTPERREVRIMVTLAAAKAREYGFVRRLVEHGADVVRINCAHETPEAWTEMASNARRAARETGRPCRVLIDLQGPRARTGRVAGVGDEVRVGVGDAVRLVHGRPERAPEPPQVECTVPGLIERLGPGAEACIDEGRIRLVCEQTDGESALLRVTHVESKGLIRRDKGLNFPGTDLELDALTEKDVADLETVAPIADIVGYSFVRSAADVARLQGELTRLAPDRRLAIAAKVETALAVRNLPEIIVQGAGAQPLAVMIARGDLAVEIGFGRLAEIQEEILWLCEAAHVPVVWATHVLDSFVRKGSHSRAEMTDAAMAERAECVMLNKGPFVVDAVRVLDDVLSRMEAHQAKKTSRLRALHSW
ncbi:MAG TPA: pyruvate kinase [Gaiellaceae bacterium]|jgi:pyruvate kinase